MGRFFFYKHPLKKYSSSEIQNSLVDRKVERSIKSDAKDVHGTRSTYDYIQ